MDKFEEQIKTIRMPKESWDKWEAALLSGEYKQGREALYDKETGGYCCLGVLQHCLAGEVETNARGNPFIMPSLKWLEERGISFRGESLSDSLGGGLSYLSQAPTVKVLSNRYRFVSDLNDDGVPFSEIVEAMRPHVETY